MKYFLLILILFAFLSFSKTGDTYWLAQADIEETSQTADGVIVTNYNQAYLIKAETFLEAKQIWNSYIKAAFKKGSIIRKGTYDIRKVDKAVIIDANDLK